MNKRGVSPVIATVLLIGIVIALALIVFLWFKSFTQEAVTKFGGENIQLVCSDAKFNAGYSGGGELDLSNTGNVPIYSFNLKAVSTQGSYQTTDLSQLFGNWPISGLNQGGTFSGNIGSLISGTTTQIIIIPILRGTTSSGTQESFTCPDQYGQTISLS